MRVFFVESKNPYTLDLIEGLSHTECRVTHAGSHDIAADEESLRRKMGCKNIQLVDAVALYKRDTLKSCYNSYFLPVDLQILQFFEVIERDFYILTDRSNHQPISFRQRKLYFRDLIRFWLGYLKKERIDAVYCPYAPHVGWELVLMQACRYLDVPFVYFSHTAINNRSLLRESYADIEVVPEGYLKGLSINEIKAQINPDLIKDFEEESLVTVAIKAENDAFNKQDVNTDQNLLSLIQQRAQNQITIILHLKRMLGRAYYSVFGRTKRRFYLPLAMDNESSLASWSRALRRHKKVAEELKAFYESHAGGIDLSEPYIYFPMHLQPEMTTQPEAGVFEDHYFVLEHILACLPEGWKVYVKENPRQYDVTINAVSAVNFRDRKDIEDLMRSPKVCLVPQSVRTTDLISHARIVVTQTGTVGWECLTSGKPCVTFGRPWYSGCHSCFKVSHIEDLKMALEKARNHPAGQVEADLIRFLHFYQNRFFIGSLSDPTNVAYNTRPYNELIEGHINALVFFFKEKHKGQLSVQEAMKAK